MSITERSISTDCRVELQDLGTCLSGFAPLRVCSSNSPLGHGYPNESTLVWLRN